MASPSSRPRMRAILARTELPKWRIVQSRACPSALRVVTLGRWRARWQLGHRPERNGRPAPAGTAAKQEAAQPTARRTLSSGWRVSRGPAFMT